MATYTYTIDIYAKGTHEVLRQVTGEVEAERYSHACTQAWKEIEPEFKAVGSNVAGPLRVERKEGQ